MSATPFGPNAALFVKMFTNIILVSTEDDDDCPDFSADHESPTIVFPVPDLAVFFDGSADAGKGTATITFTVGASDNQGVASASLSHPPSNPIDEQEVTYDFPIGTTTVTYEVVDTSGNSVTQSFDVIVADSEDPTVVFPDSDLDVGTDFATNTATVTFTVGASDNVAVASASLSHPPSNPVDEQEVTHTFPVGSTTVTYEVVDTAGNVATHSFNVNVYPTCPEFQMSKIHADATCESLDPGNAVNRRLALRSGCRYGLTNCRLSVEASGEVLIEHGAELLLSGNVLVTNRGTVEVAGSLRIDQGTFSNENLLTVAEQGSVQNQDKLHVTESGALHIFGGLSNSGVFTNAGMLSEGSNGGSPRGVTNEGNFVNNNEVVNTGSFRNLKVFKNFGTVENRRFEEDD
jgi:hypothetical protein